MPETAARPLLKVTEVAQRLGVSRMTIYRLISTGELPAVRVAGALRVDQVELDRYVYGEEEQR
jgi:excisionase family DNA binding protein